MNKKRFFLIGSAAIFVAGLCGNIYGSSDIEVALQGVNEFETKGEQVLNQAAETTVPVLAPDVSTSPVVDNSVPVTAAEISVPAIKADGTSEVDIKDVTSAPIVAGDNKEQGVGMEKIHIGINEKDLTTSVSLLNTLLADEFVLLVQTLNFHWNLVGPEFHDYHILFDGQYKAIFEYIDAIAERVRALGGTALGSMAHLLAQATLKESSSVVPSPKEMVKILLDQHEKVITQIRLGINKTGENSYDMGTNNFLSDLITKHEKTAWMLRSLIN